MTVAKNVIHHRSASAKKGEPVSPDSDQLEELGYGGSWHKLFEPHASAGLSIARVIRNDRGSAIVATTEEVFRAKPSRRLQKAATGPVDLPVVGDWVGVRRSGELEIPLIEAVLDRKSAITRGSPEKASDIQVLAANIDYVFVVHPIAGPPNLRRIERELSLAWDSGATPVVVLTKADLSDDPPAARRDVESVALGADVHITNALADEGIKPLLAYISGHRTAVLVGPSGAGKSTIINALLGRHRQATSEVRVGDGRGRHTTVTRDLIQMPGGGLLIDTPGLRALGQTGSEEGISSAFPEIQKLAGACRFRDCAHEHEPGCAVKSAVESGKVEAERLASYQKLMAEAGEAARKTEVRLRDERDRKGKIISKAAKAYFKRHKRG